MSLPAVPCLPVRNADDEPEWSGINALLYYGPTLMRELGLQGESVTLTVSGGIGIVQFLAVLPAIVFIDRIGVPR